MNSSAEEEESTMHGECPFKLPIQSSTDGQPPRVFAEFHTTDRQPIPVELPDGTPCLLVSDLHDVKQVLGRPEWSRATAAQLPGAGYGRGRLTGLLNTDDPEHSHVRGYVSGGFSARRVENHRNVLENLVQSLISGAAIQPTSPTTRIWRQWAPAEPIDLVASFARPLAEQSIRIFSGLKVVPDEFWSAALITLRHDVDAAQVATARNLVDQTLSDQLDDASGEPTLLGDLKGETDAGTLSRGDAVATLSALLIAGREGTANILARHIYAALTIAGVRDALIASPVEAVEELLRLYPSSNEGVLRVALRDTYIGQHFVKSGTVVLPLIAAATRDPGVYANPWAFDESRFRSGPGRVPAISFGHGAHHCLAGALVRLQLAIALPALVRSFPDLRLATAAHEVDHGDHALILGPKELLVWTSAA